MIRKALFTACALLCVISNNAQPMPRTTQLSNSNKAVTDADEDSNDAEWQQNMDLLREIQQKMEILAGRLQTYKNRRTTEPEEDESSDGNADDCASGCDIVFETGDRDNENHENKSNMTTLFSISFGGILFPGEVSVEAEPSEVGSSNDYGQGDAEESERDTDQYTESGNDIVNFPAAIEENDGSGPDMDVEVFDPSEDRSWRQDTVNSPHEDDDRVRGWVLASSDVNHDTGLFDSNIFTSRGEEYPNVNMFRSADGETDERSIAMEAARHRQKFDELFRSLFEK